MSRGQAPARGWTSEAGRRRAPAPSGRPRPRQRGSTGRRSRKPAAVDREAPRAPRWSYRRDTPEGGQEGNVGRGRTEGEARPDPRRERRLEEGRGKGRPGRLREDVAGRAVEDDPGVAH